LEFNKATLDCHEFFEKVNNSLGSHHSTYFDKDLPAESRCLEIISLRTPIYAPHQLTVEEVWVASAALVSLAALFLVACAIFLSESYRRGGPASPLDLVAAVRTRRGPAISWGLATNIFPALVLSLYAPCVALPMSLCFGVVVGVSASAKDGSRGAKAVARARNR
jgi:hypothetical protein